MSTTRFLLAQGVGFVLVTIGILLARRLKFPQMMLVILGTIVLVNGITHTVTALSIMSYGPGLWSSIFIWMPLGLFTGVRTFTLEPAGTATRVHVREEYTGPMLPLIWRSMPDLGPSFRQFANGLKQRAES